jgi:hypothetical protein
MLCQDVYGVIFKYLRPLKILQLASELSKPNDEVLQLGDAASVYLLGSKVLALELKECDYLEDGFVRTKINKDAYLRYTVTVRLSESYSARFINAHNPARVEEFRINLQDSSKVAFSLPATLQPILFRPTELIYESNHYDWTPDERYPSLLNFIDVSLVKNLQVDGIDADVIKRMLSLEAVDTTGFCAGIYGNDAGDEYADALKNVHTINDHCLNDPSDPEALFEPKVFQRLLFLSPNLTKFGCINLGDTTTGDESFEPFVSSLMMVDKPIEVNCRLERDYHSMNYEEYDRNLDSLLEFAKNSGSFTGKLIVTLETWKGGRKSLFLLLKEIMDVPKNFTFVFVCDRLERDAEYMQDYINDEEELESADA